MNEFSIVNFKYFEKARMLHNARKNKKIDSTWVLCNVHVHFVFDLITEDR